MGEVFVAKLKGVGISPRKARLVADLVRGKLVAQVMDQLKVSNRKAAPIFRKLISSAMTNATTQASVDVDRLCVATAFVDQGPVLKRYLPRAQGRATQLKKKSAHITIQLIEI